MHDTFVAIDFETADFAPDSACAVGLVRVEDGRIVQRASTLLCPPRRQFMFTHVHGLRWRDVRQAPTFARAWPGLVGMLDGASFLAAHNADFDQAVLYACCDRAGLSRPTLPFQCTVHLARARWNQRPNGLSDVCARLGVPLRHHDAGSDAEACARIVIAAGGVEALRSCASARAAG